MAKRTGQVTKSYKITFSHLGRGKEPESTEFIGTVKKLEKHIDDYINTHNSFLSRDIGWTLDLKSGKGSITGGFHTICDISVETIS
jgi:hypothetical protein